MHLDQQQHSRERCTPSRNTHLTSLCMSHISSILIKYSSCKFLSLLHYLHPICILYLHNGASIEGLAGLAGLRVLRVLRVLQVCGSWGSADLAGLAGLRVLRVLRVCGSCGYYGTFIIIPSYIPYMLIVFMTSVGIDYLFFIK
jgi:hypothetical protein